MEIHCIRFLGFDCYLCCLLGMWNCDFPAYWPVCVSWAPDCLQNVHLERVSHETYMCWLVPPGVSLLLLRITGRNPSSLSQTPVQMFFSFSISMETAMFKCVLSLFFCPVLPIALRLPPPEKVSDLFEIPGSAWVLKALQNSPWMTQ